MLVMASGYFDPIHPGHCQYLLSAALLGDELIVMVNGDNAAALKKGRAFQPAAMRADIVRCIRGVTQVIVWDEVTMDKVLEILHPDIFAKGGDRVDELTIPEWATCNRLGIRIITGCGGVKTISSSQILRDWKL